MDDLLSRKILELSPYDEDFPTKLLNEAFNLRIEEANQITKKVYEEIKVSPVYSELIGETGEEKIRLVVDVSDNFIKDYKDGTIKLANEKGCLVAQVRKNGRYGEKLPIKEENYFNGMTMLDISNALQLKAIQDSIAEISQQIQAIDESVREVLTGQQNDRLGLYYSGVALYKEAMSVSDAELRKHIIAQAIKTLTDSTFQLMLTLQSDIKYLKNKEYDANKKNKYNLIVEKMDNINRSFSAIHQASILKAGIFCQQGELRAMASVLQEYSRFIEGTIVRNSYMLAQCDLNDTGKADGIWNKRAQLQLNVSNVVKQLNESEQVLYIESEGKENESF